MEEQSASLVTAVERHLAGWVVSCVHRHTDDEAAVDAARTAGVEAAAAVVEELRDLLARDIDGQRTTPLAVLRGAVRWPTDVLRTAGVPPARRDDFSIDRFPDDVYDLTPATFADVHPQVGDAGIAWGAAKAFTHRARHAPAERDRG